MNGLKRRNVNALKVVAMAVLLLVLLSGAPVGAEQASVLLTMYGYPVLDPAVEGKKLEEAEQDYRTAAQSFYNGTMLSAAHELALRNETEALARLEREIHEQSGQLTELERLMYAGRTREVPYIMELDERYRTAAFMLDKAQAEREARLAQLLPEAAGAIVDPAAREREWSRLHSLGEQVHKQQERYTSSLSYPELGDIAAFRSPLGGAAEVTSPFGMRADPLLDDVMTFHSGVDLRADEGTPVQAAFHGVVEDAGEHTNLGVYVVLHHGRGIRTVYGHLSAYQVEVGQEIKQYETIAASGNTGARTTGPHLHFGLTIDGRAVDPAVLMRQ